MTTELYKGITVDYSRDALMTDFGKATVNDRYLWQGENIQQMFARVALAGADDLEHGQRMYDYISEHWCIGSTPILSNADTDRGLEISCFLNEVPDKLAGIFGLYHENAHLAAGGGGIGSYWGNLRGIGAKVRGGGETSGVIPFLKIMDACTIGVSQGGQRRGSAAAYLPINHPEIEEFIDIRKATGGDPNRKCLNLFNGITITDEFMNCVRHGEPFSLRCPKTGETTSTVDARGLFAKILTSRMETGTPYLVFIDTVNKHIPEFHKKDGLVVKTSNLCSEISLATNEERTAVCCLFQINQLYADKWMKAPKFIEDIVRYTDNILQKFIDKAKNIPGMEKAVFSASQERSLGIGVMGFHSYLQSKNIPFESAMAQSINQRIGDFIKTHCDAATELLAREKGPCPDAARHGVMRRNANVTAIAPTASVSIICGTVSPSMEPMSANAFTQKTLSGSFLVKNQFLEKVLEGYGKNTKEIWSSIITHEGSVQHLEFLSEWEKDVFKTAFELDQRWVLTHAAVRQKYVDQMISTNLFLRPDVHKKVLMGLHVMAFELGLKSLYYLRSLSIRRADKVSHSVQREKLDEVVEEKGFSSFDADGCLSCQ